MENTSAELSELTSVGSPPGSPPASSLDYMVEGDFSGYSLDVLRTVPGLGSPVQGPGFVYPDPQTHGHALPEEDADELNADPEAADDESDEEEGEYEEEDSEEDDDGAGPRPNTDDESDELQDSSPVRAKQPLPSQGFASAVPLRLPPPHAEELQTGGGYKHLQAEPLPPDQQPATRLRPTIRPTGRANATARSMHARRGAPELPPALPVASTSAAPPPPPSAFVPPNFARDFPPSPSKLARSTSIEPGVERIAQGRLAAKGGHRASSVVPPDAQPPTFTAPPKTRVLLSKAEHRARRQAQADEEERAALPPPPHSTLWEEHPLPPGPNPFIHLTPSKASGSANAHLGLEMMENFKIDPAVLFQPPPPPKAPKAPPKPRRVARKAPAKASKPPPDVSNAPPPASAPSTAPPPPASAPATAPPPPAPPLATAPPTSASDLFSTDDNVIHARANTPSAPPFNDGNAASPPAVHDDGGDYPHTTSVADSSRASSEP
ncbi:hypothetical protein R3P38DRAFT_2760912 [Favolaschia claudopus]|uniref:Uncharacterized protein n=1 Tax=Favolaschia claudopus TaxID=2862362 RepID=A0AAW0DX80_9AGAR